MAGANHDKGSLRPPPSGAAAVLPPAKARAHDYAPTPCPICGAVIKHRSNFMRHVRRHQDGKTTACSKCGKRFRDKSELRNHLESGVHMAPKPVFTCATCGGKYTSQRALLHHSHDRVSAFPCDICRRKFQTAVVCAAHRRRHFWRGLARCRACNATFAVEEHLSRHIRNHEKETTEVVRY